MFTKNQQSMINVNQLYTELLKLGKNIAYPKVKRAVEGVPNTTTKAEKAEIIAVLEKEFKEIKKNILKS